MANDKGNGRPSDDSLLGLLSDFAAEPADEQPEAYNSRATLSTNEDEPDADVWAKLNVDSKGNVRNTINNVLIIMTYDPQWSGRFSYNAFSGSVMLDNTRLADTEITGFRIGIGRRYGIEPAKGKVWEVADLVARSRTFNPLSDYLNSLHWDGIERNSKWTIRALGADDTPINRVMSRKWCISAVARALDPGCKLDTVLLLAGPQGIGKSTAFRALSSDEWFSDTEITLGNKDAYMQIREVWIYEMAEMTALHKTRKERVKSFLSSSTDNYRVPYGRIVSQVPRHTVFVATTNEETPLDDPTGSRRFWPIATPGPLDQDWLEENRDQIWAEAVVAFKAGHRWHLDDQEELERERVARDFEHVDPWTSHVASWAEERHEFTIRACLEEALRVPSQRQGREHLNRIGAVLRRLGYTKRKARRNETADGSRPWLWFRREKG